MKPRAFDLGIFVWLLQIARYLCSQDPILAIRPLGRMSVIKFLCGLEIMKTILLFSLSPYLSSAVSLLFPRLFIPFGFTAGGTDSTLLTDTQTN